MIDCGASRNFLSVGLVKKLAIPQVGTSDYGVLMGTSWPSRARASVGEQF